MKKFSIILIKYLLFFMGWTMVLVAAPDIEFKEPAFLRLYYEVKPLVIVLLFTLVFVWGIEKRKIKIPLWSDFYRTTFIGIIAGVFWLGSAVGILYLTGTMSFHGVNTVNYLWVWILASLLNVFTQELLIRGYLYQLCKHHYNTIVAAIVTTIVFTALHGGAFEAGPIAVFNVLTMSVFVSVLLEYTGTLWAPILVHFLWNAIGSIILGGFNLALDYPKLLDCTFAGNALLSGGDYKLEGSIVVLLLNSALTVFFFILLKKKQQSKEKNLYYS